MLGVARLQPPICFPLISHSQPYKQHNYTPLFILKRTGFCLFAQKKQQNSSFSEVELKRQDFDDGFEVNDEDDYDEFYDDDLDDVDDEGDDSDELMVPFDKMDEWLEKKPKGFGEGKVYDTSVEDKLLEELEKIREAQLVNIAKLKNGTKVAEPKKEIKEIKVSEVALGCVRVRINNLPKKKNVHRDLKSAFQGVHGIANIFPMVSGTKKTRDPVCKGFAFVDFKSLEDANRFVQLFSGQNISFGKTEKRIKCEILKPSDDSKGGPMPDKYNIISKSRITVLEEEADQVDDDDIGKHDPQLVSWDDDDFDELDDDSDDEDVMENFELIKSMDQSDIESIESRLLKQSLDLLPTTPKEKKVGNKKPAVKKKPENATKVKLPGSSNRLKVHSHLDELDEDSDDEDIVENFELLTSMEQSVESVESRFLSQSNESSSAKPKEKRMGKKKPAVKKKPDNATKVKLPGSSKRLKDREKAKLADVFSRYGVRQEALASKEM